MDESLGSLQDNLEQLRQEIAQIGSGTRDSERRSRAGTGRPKLLENTQIPMGQTGLIRTCENDVEESEKKQIRRRSERLREVVTDVTPEYSYWKNVGDAIQHHKNTPTEE